MQGSADSSSDCVQEEEGVGMNSISFTVVVGVAKCIGLGFHLDKYHFGIDLGPFYIGVEW